mmetsp:Transcript_38383/g.99154  ORF Transcript_38383/g.99154 Transcript_38383/m.99154 type:complete len:498 (-) Transcript_38383:55-1548(-)
MCPRTRAMYCLTSVRPVICAQMCRSDTRDFATTTAPLVPRSRRWQGAATVQWCPVAVGVAQHLFHTQRMRLPSTPSQCGVEHVAHPEGLYMTRMSLSGISFRTHGCEPVPCTTTPLCWSKASAPTKRFGLPGSQKGSSNSSQLSLPAPVRRLAGSAPAAPSSWSEFLLPLRSSMRILPLFTPSSLLPGEASLGSAGPPFADTSDIIPSGSCSFAWFTAGTAGTSRSATSARVAAAASSSSSLSISKSASSPAMAAAATSSLSLSTSSLASVSVTAASSVTDVLPASDAAEARDARSILREGCSWASWAAAKSDETASGSCKASEISSSGTRKGLASASAASAAFASGSRKVHNFGSAGAGASTGLMPGASGSRKGRCLVGLAATPSASGSRNGRERTSGCCDAEAALQSWLAESSTLPGSTMPFGTGCAVMPLAAGASVPYADSMLRRLLPRPSFDSLPTSNPAASATGSSCATVAAVGPVGRPPVAVRGRGPPIHV